MFTGGTLDNNIYYNGILLLCLSAYKNRETRGSKNKKYYTISKNKNKEIRRGQTTGVWMTHVVPAPLTEKGKEKATVGLPGGQWHKTPLSQHGRPGVILSREPDPACSKDPQATAQDLRQPIKTKKAAGPHGSEQRSMRINKLFTKGRSWPV